MLNGIRETVKIEAVTTDDLSKRKNVWDKDQGTKH